MISSGENSESGLRFSEARLPNESGRSELMQVLATLALDKTVQIGDSSVVSVEQLSLEVIEGILIPKEEFEAFEAAIYEDPRTIRTGKVITIKREKTSRKPQVEDASLPVDELYMTVLVDGVVKRIYVDGSPIFRNRTIFGIAKSYGVQLQTTPNQNRVEQFKKLIEAHPNVKIGELGSTKKYKIDRSIPFSAVSKLFFKTRFARSPKGVFQQTSEEEQVLEEIRQMNSMGLPKRHGGGKSGKKRMQGRGHGKDEKY